MPLLDPTLLVSDLVPKLRIVMRDQGSDEIESFFADGVISSWKLKHSIIIQNSVTVLYDGNPTSNYTLDYNTSTINFNPTPSKDTVVEIRYKYYNYSDSFLEDYLVDAINTVSYIADLDLEVTKDSNNDYVVSEPIGEIKLLWCKVANYLIRKDNLAQDAENAFDWTDADVSVREVSNIRARQALLEEMWNGLLNELQRILITEGKGKILVGGTEPNPYGVGADGASLL